MDDKSVSIDVDEDGVEKNTAHNNSKGVDHNAVKDLKKTPVEEVEDFKKLGNTEFQKANYDAAITYYTQALSICPASEKILLSKVYQNRAAAYSKLNNNEDCVADCDKALKLVPLYKKALSIRARALSEIGNFKLALEDITAVVNLKSKNQKDIMFADSVLKSLGQQNLQEYIKNDVFNLPSKTFIEGYMQSFCDDPFNNEFAQTLVKSDVNTGLELALKSIKNKNYEEIEEACKEELNKTDNSLIRRTLALNLFATFTILRGNYAAGIEHLTTVIETTGVSNKLVINSLIKRASVYHKKGQFEKCIEDLKIAENIDPKSSEVFYHRATIYLEDMKIDKPVEELKIAVEEFKKAVELNPNFVSSNFLFCYTQCLLAHQMSNELDFEKYLRKLKGFLIKYPENFELYILYSQALGLKEAYQEADQVLKKLHEIHPDNANVLVCRACVVVAWKSNKYRICAINKAIDFLEKALKIDPKCGCAHELLGVFYVNRKQFKEGVECLEKAIALAKSKKELLQLFSMRDSARAKLGVNNRLGKLYF